MKDPENIPQDSEVKDRRRAKSPGATKEPPKLKAVLDGRRLPIELFGSGHARYIRKLVYNYIATWADPDGTESFPSRKTIAKHCGLTDRTVSKVVAWLEQHCLLRVDYKASRYGTNRYTVLFSAEDQAACRAALEGDEEEQRLLKKAEKTRNARTAAAKSRWARQKPRGSDEEHNVPDEQPETGNAVFLQNEERFASDEERVACPPGTGCMLPGTQRSYNRPLDRTEVNRPSSPSTTPSEESPVLQPSDCSADDAVGDVSLSSLNAGQPGAEPLFDHGRFKADVVKLLRVSRVSAQTKDSHWEQAFTLAQEHGAKVFLAALDLWIRNERRQDAPSVLRTWVLKCFLDSGAALDSVEQVKQGSGISSQRDTAEFEKFKGLVYLHSGHAFSRKDLPDIQELVEQYGADDLFWAWKDFLSQAGDNEFEQRLAPSKFAGSGGAVIRYLLQKKKEREDLMRRYEISIRKENERVWAENEEILRRQAEEAALINDDL